MNCETARLLLEKGDPALPAHLQSCPSCLMGAHLTYYTAPPDLESKISRQLQRETASPPYWRWAAIAASLLLLASLAANFQQFRSRTPNQQLLAATVLSAHVRSLAGTHLLDVPSSDQHTVKPWFNGKLDFSPPVKTVPGFPLLGGRLEYFEGRPAAALVYARGQHIVNLFLWPASSPTAEATQTRNGYHMQSWSNNGMTLWAVSDLNEAELRGFVSLYRSLQP